MFSLAIVVDFNESCAEKKCRQKDCCQKNCNKKRWCCEGEEKIISYGVIIFCEVGFSDQKFHLSLLLYGCYMALIAQPYGKCHRHMTGPTVLPLHYLFH